MKKKHKSPLHNTHIDSLTPYTLASHKVWSYKDKEKVLKLDWNESTIAPPPNVIQTLLTALTSEKLNWYPNTNNTELIKKISNYAKIPEKHIQYFAGSDAIHEYIIRIFSKHNDTALLISPTYDNFRFTCESFGLKVRYFELNHHFQFEVNKFIQQVSNTNPKVIYICNPNNPTGTTYPNTLIEKLLALHPQILFIIDEAYYEFANHTSKDLTKKFKNIIICRTFSKAFGLASFRIGYIVAHPNIINIVSKVRNPKNISTLAQIAASTALSNVEYVSNFVKENNIAKKEFEIFLEKNLPDKIHFLKGSGNFILLKTDQQKELISFLENNHVYTRVFNNATSLKNNIRITIGTKEQMQKNTKITTRFFFNRKKIAIPYLKLK